MGGELFWQLGVSYGPSRSSYSHQRWPLHNSMSGSRKDSWNDGMEEAFCRSGKKDRIVMEHGRHIADFVSVEDYIVRTVGMVDGSG